MKLGINNFSLKLVLWIPANYQFQNQLTRSAADKLEIFTDKLFTEFRSDIISKLC